MVIQGLQFCLEIGCAFRYDFMSERFTYMGMAPSKAHLAPILMKMASFVARTLHQMCLIMPTTSGYSLIVVTDWEPG